MDHRDPAYVRSALTDVVGTQSALARFKRNGRASADNGRAAPVHVCAPCSCMAPPNHHILCVGARSVCVGARSAPRLTIIFIIRLYCTLYACMIILYYIM